MTDARPGPHLDPDNAPFWAGLQRGVVVVQECEACGRRRFGRLGACPQCGRPGGIDVEVSGEGTVYSFVRVHRALTPDAPDDLPYAVGTIDLDGGARVLGRVEPPDAAASGVRGVPRFVDRVDFNTSPGYIAGPGARAQAGLAAQGPNIVVSTFGIFAFDTADGGQSGSCEMVLQAVYPNMDPEIVQLETGWDLRVAPSLREVEPPTREELALLRRLDPHGFYLVPGRY